jgi:hypothetical protein
MKSLYGVPALSVSDLVANFMMEQGNSNQSHYAGNLVRAARVWEDLTFDTIWKIKYKAVTVNPKDNSIKMPSDMLRLLNLNVVNECGLYVPLGFNPAIATVKMDCPAKVCSCETCKGDNSYCVALDAVSVVSETVYINGYPFDKKTWTQKGDGGTLQKVIQYPYPILPYPQSGAPTIEYRTEYETVCTLDVTETNCIKPTESNRQLLEQHCGCTVVAWQQKMCCSTDGAILKSDYGYWNWDAQCPDQKVILKDVKAKQVIIAYQSSGNCGTDELIIPRRALDAMQYGIVHRQVAWSPAANRLEKREAKNAYEESKWDLSRWLHPVDIDAMDQLRDIIMKW